MIRSDFDPLLSFLASLHTSSAASAKALYFCISFADRTKASCPTPLLLREEDQSSGLFAAGTEAQRP